MWFFNKQYDDGSDFIKLAREFTKIADGGPIPRDGACSFFYNHFTYAGETLPLKIKDRYAFFHIENDDVIQEILSGVPSVQVTADDGRKIVSLLFKNGEIINWVQLIIDTANRDSFDILSSIIKKKKIELNLLNMIYGAIVKEKTLTIPIPKDTIEKIKKAAG